MKRLVDGLLIVLGVGVLAGLGGFAWLTRHPEAPIIDRAAEWPGVGPVAEAFRDTYRGPPPLEPVAPARESESEVFEQVPWRPPPPPWDPRRAGEPRWVWVRDGAVLRAGAAETARSLHVVEGFYKLPRLERSGDWFRVWRGGREAWVHLPGYRADGSGGPPFGDAPAPPGPLPGRTPDPRRLDATLAALDPAHRRQGRVGPYELHTDLPTDSASEALIAWLSTIADQVESAYAARYRVTPIDRPRGAVVLFGSRARYLLARDAVADTAGLPSSGHAASGMVVLHVVEERGETASTLVHEIVHLLTRRALGPALPPWLGEGLAEELASAAIDLDGTLQPGRLGGRRLELPTRFIYTGAKGSLWSLRQRLEREPSLPRRVLALEREAFLAGDPRPRYDLAAAWIAFLLEADGGRRAPVLYAFLEAVAAGEDPSIDALVDSLRLAGATDGVDQDWSALEAALRRYVTLRTVAFGAPSAAPD
ncbi:MAG: hypothetical protein AAGC60_07670 [Acidobacteriota bacterium]